MGTANVQLLKMFKKEGPRARHLSWRWWRHREEYRTWGPLRALRNLGQFLSYDQRSGGRDHGPARRSAPPRSRHSRAFPARNSLKCGHTRSPAMLLTARASAQLPASDQQISAAVAMIYRRWLSIVGWCAFYSAATSAACASSSPNRAGFDASYRAFASAA